MHVDTLTWDEQSGWSGPPLEVGPSTALFAFGSRSIENAEHSPLRDLHAMAERSGAVLLGCSTAGHALDTEGRCESLAVTAATFERTDLVSAHVSIAQAGGPRRAGRRIAERLAHPDLRGVFVLADGLEVNGSLLALGIRDVLPGVPVSGGLAADDDRFERTWVIANGVARDSWVTAIGFVGDHVSLGFGSAGGWDTFGPERLVTRSYGNVLYQIDDRPALDLYREYLGEAHGTLPAAAMLMPLHIRDLDGRTVVRTVVDIDEAKGSLRFAGDIVQGGVAHLMCATHDNLIHGALLAGKQASQENEQLAIAVSCVGRRMMLGERADEELEAVSYGLAPGAAIAGFYSYGELSPTDGHCDLHNQTMTVTTIAETIDDGAV